MIRLSLAQIVITTTLSPKMTLLSVNSHLSRPSSEKKLGTRRILPNSDRAYSNVLSENMLTGLS